MDQILGQIGSTIGGFFGNPVVQLGIRAIGIYVVVLWLAAAYWAFRDLQGRTDNPVAPYVAASLIIVFTPVFFVLAVIVYRIVRPHERIGEVNERSLAEEALLNEVEAVPHCPGCARRVNEEWLICPTCRTRLNRVCPNCNRLVGLDWSLCAWCGKDFERRDLTAVPRSVPAPEPLAVPAQIPAAQSLSRARSPKPAGGIRAAAVAPAPDALPEH